MLDFAIIILILAVWTDLDAIKKAIISARSDEEEERNG